MSEASFVRRRVAAQASRPTSGLRAIGIPVCYMNQQPWCVTVAIVHITFMSHSDTIVNCSDNLCSGVESIAHTCGQASGSVHLRQDITYYS